MLIRKSFPLMIAYVVTSINAQTALLFGANGMVGSEVLKAIVRNPFWEKVILAGRRFPPKVTDLLKHSKPEVVQVQLSDLSKVDKRLVEIKADACFIAVGSGAPHETNLSYWHSVEVDMVASITRLCNQIDVQYVAVLSAIDAEEEPAPFSEEELNDDMRTLGWWRMIKSYARMMGLKEMAVKTESKNIQSVRFFRPSNIITKEIRYGWLDWSLFKFHKVFDPILPTKYHSVKVELLGAAFAGDAVLHLNRINASGVTQLIYHDFLRITAEDKCTASVVT